MSELDMRVTIAACVASALQDAYPKEPGNGIHVQQTETTSGCPIVQLTVNGTTYNLTITKARKS